MTKTATTGMSISTPLASALKATPARGPLSPLPANDASLNAEQKKEGRQAGLLDLNGNLAPDIRTAAVILSDPAVEIRSAYRGLNETLALHAYADARGTLVGCTPESGSRIKILKTVKPEQLAGILIGGLGMTLQTPDPGIRIDMSMEALWTLAGIVDAMREEQLQTLLAHNMANGLSCRKDRILANIQKGIVAGDSRWLCTLIYSLSPVETVMTDASVDHGLAELEKQDWIQTDKNGTCRFSGVWQPVLMALGFCVGAGMLAVRRKAANNISVFQVAFIRAMGNLWSFDFDLAGGHRVFVQTADGLGMARAVDLLIQNALTPTPTAPAVQEQKLPSLPATPPATAEEKKFCSQCGKPLAPKDCFCPACGTAA